MTLHKKIFNITIIGVHRNKSLPGHSIMYIYFHYSNIVEFMFIYRRITHFTTIYLHTYRYTSECTNIYIYSISDEMVQGLLMK